MKFYISQETGCIYWLVSFSSTPNATPVIGYIPINADNTVDLTDMNYVDEDLVGDELVRGSDTKTLSNLY